MSSSKHIFEYDIVDHTFQTVKTSPEIICVYIQNCNAFVMVDSIVMY